jgi:glycosyltransferase involved in cell wall biosynthesis
MSRTSREPVVAMLAAGELFGGVERHLLGMCTWLMRQGSRPILILFHDGELARQARQLGCEPVVLAVKGSFDVAYPKRLAAHLAEEQVDVVHAHGYRAIVNAALARRHFPFRLVVTLHGLIEPEPPFTIAWLKSRIYSWLESQSIRRTDATVCYVTNDLRLRRPTGARAELEQSVYNGIDPYLADPPKRPIDLPDEGFRIAAIGRVSPIKGLDTVIRAFATPGFPENVVFDIIGTGPSVDELKALVAKLGLERRIRFLGFKQDIMAYMAGIDVLVMPSLHEGLPYTILEAMSIGTAIIASEVGGLKEILLDGESALIVPPGDVSAWAAALARLVAEPEMVVKLGATAKEQQKNDLNLDTMGTNYRRIYNEA